MFPEMLGAIDTTAVDTAITSGITLVEGLVGAGLGLLVVFLTAKIIRKGVSKVG